MKKDDLKYVVDALLFADVCSIAVLGLLMAYVIPPGQVAHAETLFLGLHRQDWANLHLYLSLGLLALLVLHLFLSWGWIAQSTRRYFGAGWKKALLVLCFSWVLIILLGWIKMRY
jgi:hypothetical protein